uniref:Phage portal protein, lambda family n=1 Tax=Candidatus Kentrum sp. FM TaxID=2126340 RepID=A0A450T2W1_9GAMM|nr:MAG: Phage portal protein, lambda family [Candidatus Kentron sp. FM]VFJ60855.1 MAG: Phage portal protein, lambda family [Candidatus Kentron sp. FM]VFK13120.1 MAG: Phage portal protein, lambda family [Candidatus Kentron sp. FM]
MLQNQLHLRSRAENKQISGEKARFIDRLLYLEATPREIAWGRRKVLHVFEPERPGQTRGKSGIAAILAKSKTLERFQDVNLEAAIVNAMCMSRKNKVPKNRGGNSGPPRLGPGAKR